ncbi:MAG: hypothetical protein Fur0025_03760 [Oscillatoriaceae cyanobacterium]|uniref:hypothetical protein n=1 Tax=[Phormidium] sp. ETS-05 TaxID=222819 RepID=UPI0018EEEF2A|nr:hypothetical protein [[Phormidium] sp. ETS-05]
MTQPPLNEQQLAELAEMLELAKTTEQKARELNEMTIAFEEKWQRRLDSRQGTQPQASQR